MATCLRFFSANVQLLKPRNIQVSKTFFWHICTPPSFLSTAALISQIHRYCVALIKKFKKITRLTKCDSVAIHFHLWNSNSHKVFGIQLFKSFQNSQSFRCCHVTTKNVFITIWWDQNKVTHSSIDVEGQIKFLQNEDQKKRRQLFSSADRGRRITVAPYKKRSINYKGMIFCISSLTFPFPIFLASFFVLSKSCIINFLGKKNLNIQIFLFGWRSSAFKK